MTWPNAETLTARYPQNGESRGARSPQQLFNAAQPATVVVLPEPNVPLIHTIMRGIGP
jgi:hypothetical protein